jgi:hypothetical protein
LIALPALIGSLPTLGLLLFQENSTKRKLKTLFFMIRYFFGMLLYFIHTFIILLSIVATVLFNSNRLLLFVAMPLTGWFYKEYKS